MRAAAPWLDACALSSGWPQPQVEYKLRRFVNDYVAPPKAAANLEIAVETFQRMTGEIAGMGARTPHELMRCAEVTFIRDCAEMAARASLVRTESRWGLYHDRTDHPGREDADWFYHLNLRRRADGDMEFVKRPVHEYLVAVDDLQPPAGPAETLVAEVHRFAVAAPGRADARPAARPGEPAGDRIVAVLALTEHAATLAEFRPFLADPDPEVRRTAVATLTEVAPEGVADALVAALHDRHTEVRSAATAGLRELADVLPGSAALAKRLRDARTSPDPLVRQVVVELQRITGVGHADDFRAALGDSALGVRLQSVRGLVRCDDVAGLAAAAADPAREVRVAVAHGVGTVADPQGAAVLQRLAADVDPLVRAASLRAAGQVGCDGDLAIVALGAITDPSWQVREGAATALGGAAPDVAVPALTEGARDPNLDVRRAAVRSLAAWVHRADVTAVLRSAAADPDADVRAYARRALTAAAATP
ncbi:HEAT repeat protein [Krasilnikovia cinnamomea]|uniref:HEAT repeat protein n=1 Tax=Krasilnikovia cinnamomea TaxID=349313 RepID=A0A4Q7ZSI3_9ACTN|nr:HEAT repeat domain-containing protein [Krasilnikovia cinnamomea]RZU53583.1 HEAT repeat protein [Krasilnikovia cinnamomea]